MRCRKGRLKVLTEISMFPLEAVRSQAVLFREKGKPMLIHLDLNVKYFFMNAVFVYPIFYCEFYFRN